jgi:hypothetical protein
MARPRVFLSSTYYDLYQSREDIERFVRSLGYDCVRHEAGAVPYSKDSKLEASAYREVELCDMLVTIIGGKFGSESKDEEGSSITQAEITRALEKGIQVYIFVEQNTLTEYNTWKVNKNTKGMKYRYADDSRIYSFLDQLYSLPQNNSITGFKTIADVTAFLQEQWAGLFQRYLGQQKRASEISLIEDMKGISSTLQEMIKFLSDSNQNNAEALQAIISINNPIFSHLARITGTSYRVFFTNHSEMENWFNVRGYKKQDEIVYSDGSVEEWYKDKTGWIEFKKQFFTDKGELINFSTISWDEAWINFVKSPSPKTGFEDMDDDIPF